MPKPANHIDLRGQQFGLLMVMEPATSRTWRCACACGQTVEVLTANLRQNRRQCSTSCPERNSLRAKYMAQKETEAMEANDLALTARALVMAELGVQLQAMSKRDKAAFRESLDHHLKMAIGL